MSKADAEDVVEDVELDIELLRMYGGVALGQDKRDQKNQKLSKTKKKSNGHRRSAQRRAGQTKGLPKELKEIYQGCKAGRLDRGWNLQCHGGITHRRASCIAAHRAHDHCEQQKASFEDNFVHHSDAEAVLVGAYMQALSIRQEKDRDLEVRLQDALEVLRSAGRNASRILMKESDNLWRISHITEDESSREVLELEAKMKSNLAGELTKQVSSSLNHRGSHLKRLCNDLQDAVQDILHNLVNS